jgi:hypothetical protein
MTLRTLPVAAFVALVASASAADAATLASALSAYRDNHVPQAEQMFAQIAADPAAGVSDRAEARRNLGRIDFLARGETEALEAALAQPTTGQDRCALATTALQTYREAGHPERGLAAADGALPTCSPATAEALRVESARAHIAVASRDANTRAQHLNAATTDLAAISDIARGTPGVAGARFSLAIARHDAGAALQAWRDYYWLTDSDAPQALGAYAGHVQALFSAGLASSASDADVLALIEMLNRAGFTADAKQLADETGIAARAGDNPAWRKAAAMFTFDAAVRADTLRANREMMGGGHATWYGDAIRGDMGALMQATGLSGDPRTVLAENLGLYGSLGETSGYPSLHGGHLAEDRNISVDEYGHHGELRFIVIDNMLANGYESWLWDGWAQAGGWSGDGAIVQIRSAYTDGPLGSLRNTRPGPSREAFLTRLHQHEAEERTALGRDGVASLPATSARLEDQVYQQIAQRVGADDGAFIAEVWRATNQYSIAMHEGRHAIDNANGHHNAPDLEYWAKLSQIALADYPRLGLASVAGQQLGDTPHGIGNRRVLEAYRLWMRAHRGEITGFDASQPTLSQLDKLTDTQIVAVARSIDPLARGVR